jgi:hypothetical protein
LEQVSVGVRKRRCCGQAGMKSEDDPANPKYLLAELYDGYRLNESV